MVVRVQKIISSNSVISRRKAEDLIREGRVKVNGVVVSLGACADVSKDKIFVDGVLLKESKKVYLVINKPAGVVTSTFDPNEKTVMKLLPSKFRNLNLYPVGRLDKDTEGLLILTNDGDFANSVMHPSNNVKKTYEGYCKGVLSSRDISILRRGVPLDEGIARCSLKVVHEVDSSFFEIVLETGWNRQIRRMFEFVHHEVFRLRRIKIGGLSLSVLGEDFFREFSLLELKNLIGIKKSEKFAESVQPRPKGRGMTEHFH